MTREEAVAELNKENIKVWLDWLKINDALNTLINSNPFQEVYDELMKIPMFNGNHDKENANKHFIYGIETVMEYIKEKSKNYTQMKEIEENVGNNS